MTTKERETELEKEFLYELIQLNNVLINKLRKEMEELKELIKKGAKSPS